jgi:hypothetical protein
MIDTALDSHSLTSRTRQARRTRGPCRVHDGRSNRHTRPATQGNVHVQVQLGGQQPTAQHKHALDSSRTLPVIVRYQPAVLCAAVHGLHAQARRARRAREYILAAASSCCQLCAPLLFLRSNSRPVIPLVHWPAAASEQATTSPPRP